MGGRWQSWRDPQKILLNDQHISDQAERLDKLPKEEIALETNPNTQRLTFSA